ncbi:MAG: acyltransferase [Pseudomonadota bacterium]
MKTLSALFEVGHGDHRQIRSMEGLRGLAVFLVFLVHYVTLIEPWLMRETLTWDLANSLRDIGHAGVDLFFVLSGYLIYGTLIVKVRPVLPYLRRRVQRIYPAFLAVFALYLLLSWWFPQESKIPHGAVTASVYLATNLLLLPGLFPIEPMITVAWSLSYEMFYYLLVPCLIALLNLRQWTRLARMAFFCSAAVFGLALAHWLGGGPVRLVMFVAGILLFETMGENKAIHLGRFGLPALLGGLVIIDQWATGPLRYVVLFISFYLLCLAAFRGNGLTARLFCWTPLRWLGNMSYSYYLIHGLTLKAAFLLLSKVLPPSAGWGVAGFWGWMAPLFAITLLPSAILFAWVEKPLSLTMRRPPAHPSTG